MDIVQDCPTGRPWPCIWVIAALTVMAAALLAWTWRAWADPIVDFGREAYVAWRVYEGDRLYRDVAYYNGPLSPYVNMLVFRILGPSLTSLFLANFLISVLICLLIWSIVRQITSESCGFFCVVTYQTLFAYGHYVRMTNYNYIAPYSHELTHGLLLSLLGLIALRHLMASRRWCWPFVCGVLLGLVLLTKPEPFFALAAACGLAFLIAAQRKSHEPASIAGAAWITLLGTAVTLVLTILGMCTFLPWKQAIQCAFGAWPHVFSPAVTGLEFYKSSSGLDAPFWRIVVMFFWLSIQVLLVRFAWNQACRGTTHPRWLVDIGLLLTALAAVAVFPQAIHPVFAFSTLPAWLLIILAAGLHKLWQTEQHRFREKIASLLVLTVFGLGMLAKIPLNARIWHYGFALAMPGVLAVACAGWWVAQEVHRRGGSAKRFIELMVASAMLLAASYVGPMAMILGEKCDWVRMNGAPQVRAVPAQASALNRMLAEIASRLDERDTLAVWPQGAMINFLTGRSNSTGYIVLMPPEIAMFGEGTILEAYRMRPPDYVLLVPCDTSEYGRGQFGTGYGQQLWQWLRTNYYPVVGPDGHWDASGDPGLVLLQHQESSRAAPSPCRRSGVCGIIWTLTGG